MIRLRDLFSLEAVFILSLYVEKITLLPYGDLIEQFGNIYSVILLSYLILGLLFALVRSPQINSASRPVVAVYLLLLLWAWVSYISVVQYQDRYAEAKILRLTGVTTWGFLGALLFVRTPSETNRLLRLFVALGLGAALPAILFTYLGHLDSRGVFGSDNYQALGRLAGLAMVIAAVYAIFEGRRVQQCLIALYAFILAAGAIISGTRQAGVAAVCSAAYVIAFLVRNGAVRSVARIVVLVALLTLAIFLVNRQELLPENDLIQGLNRIVMLWTPDDSEFLSTAEQTHRPGLWAAAFEMWNDQPLLGAGFGTFEVVFPDLVHRFPHNTILEVMAELGLLGLVLLLAIILFTARCALVRQSPTHLRTVCAAGAAWVFSLTCIMFSGDITDMRWVLCFTAILLNHFA